MASMNRAVAALALAVLALFAVAATVSAHTAQPACGGSLTLAKGSATVDVIRTDTEPGQTVYDNAPGNGTLSVPAGTYKLVWSDGFTIAGLVVGQCEQPTPTPSPSPSPTPSPTPERSCANTPNLCPQPTPTPTPVPSPSPAATPSPSPTPELLVPPETPRLTLPPTSTGAATTPASGPNQAVGYALLALVAAGLLILAIPVRRKRDER